MPEPIDFEKARNLSWRHLGKEITFYLPGMFIMDGVQGCYPGVSITGKHCALKCDHCNGKLLQTMIPAPTSKGLVEKCTALKDKGNLGVLLTGGCNLNGQLPWEDFTSAIFEIKQKTGLFISIHCGLLNHRQAAELKTAGVDQALFDVMGDDATFKRVYHLPFGVQAISKTMEALAAAKIPMVPHVVCGLDYGRLKGEERALDMMAQFAIEQLVIVSLMPLSGTPMETVASPEANDVIQIILKARRLMPRTSISLGCARKRGDTRLETLAIDAGVNRMALPSDDAIERAKHHGLDIRWQKTCCSVPHKWLTRTLT